MEQSKLFDAAAEVEIRLRPPASGKVVARFPSDAEWAARLRKIRTLTKQLGPGETTTTVHGVEAADLELLGIVASEMPPDLDAADAAGVVERMTRAEAEGAEPAEGGYAIPLRVAGGIRTRHELRTPLEREVRRYRKAAFAFVDRRHGVQELRTSAPAVGEFYDLLCRRKEGYVGDAVPLAHKIAVVAELMQTLDALEESEENPADF